MEHPIKIDLGVPLFFETSICFGPGGYLHLFQPKWFADLLIYVQ